MRGLYAKSIAAVFWTALPALLLLGLLGPTAISLWTSSAVTVGAAIVVACGLEAVLGSLGQNAALPAYAANRPIMVCVSFLLCNTAALAVAATLVFAGHAFYLGARVVDCPMINIAREAVSPAAFWQTVCLALRRTAPA